VVSKLRRKNWGDETDEYFTMASQKRRFSVKNPRTGAEDYEFDAITMTELENTVRSSRESNRAWQDCGIHSRIDCLQQWKRSLKKHKLSIIQALAADTGRTSISVMEVDSLLSAIDRWSREAPESLTELPERSTSHTSITYKTQQAPYELAGIIGPSNFPLLLPFLDAVPALAAGCSVLVKPSELTPRFVEPLERSIADVPALWPRLQLVRGDGEVGAALVERVDVLCFTGSVESGRQVAVAAAHRLIPAFLELGGKDPAIVAETADLDLAAKAILRASIGNAGQACQSIERIYVHRKIHDSLVDRLVALAGEVAFNFPDPKRGHLGPMISASRATIILEQIDDALRQGATLRFGGQAARFESGMWLPPTIITGVHHGMTLMQEETLGPLMPVMSFNSLDEAVALANDSAYGLSAAVFAGSLEEAEAIARRLEVGAVSLNDAGLTSIINEAEKNSLKASGLGASRMGSMGLLRFLRKKSLLFQHAPPIGVEALKEG
jgi:succinate-semialdehyde dehydrogenase/glutarate-semialdehyde dehydrogenase